MKITLGWLKDHLDTAASIEEIVTKLNAIGHEVEGVEDPCLRLSGFRIARVLSAEKHPQADSLQILSVDVGGGTLGRAGDGVANGSVQVVCGAANAHAGMVGVFGAPGAVVPASGMVLRSATIRGIKSHGMMCSAYELEIGADHDGIIELPADAPIGTAFADYALAGKGVGKGVSALMLDPVIDIAITPNRQDCMGVHGIARDLAAAGVGTLKPLAVCDRASDGAGEGPCAIAVRIEDTEACLALWGRTIKLVTNRPSPEWMQHRLKAVGQRPISALVDITNYVMIDHGRPGHVYDLGRLSGALTVRKAKNGETVTALNGKTYTLTDRMTVIADEEAVHDIAGIMGGEDSACEETTSDIFLEVAYFTPEYIALTGQELGLASDARSRFERGVDPAFLEDATAILTELIVRHCGGTASQITRIGKPPTAKRSIRYHPALVKKSTALIVDPERQKHIFAALGFTVEPVESVEPEGESSESSGSGSSGAPEAGGGSGGSGTLEPGGWQVSIPTWRRDIDGAADLVEEIARITGFEHIPSTPLPQYRKALHRKALHRKALRHESTPSKPDFSLVPAAQFLERKIRRAAASAGFHEAITWSFISESEAKLFGGGDWTLSNPISDAMKVMRPSLLPGLLSAAQRNLDRGETSLRLFEIGQRYLTDGEHPTLALLMVGEKTPRSWQTGKAQGFDAYDAKSAALFLLERVGVPVDKVQVAARHQKDIVWHPGRSGVLRLGPKNLLAEFGVLHPALLEAFDLPGGVGAGPGGARTRETVAVQIFLDALPSRTRHAKARAALVRPTLQPVVRDFAFLVSESFTTADLVRAVHRADKALISSVRLFDRFTGQGIPEGQLGLAVEVTLQPMKKSLTEEDIKILSSKVIAAAAKQGAILRG